MLWFVICFGDETTCSGHTTQNINKNPKLLQCNKSGTTAKPRLLLVRPVFLGSTSRRYVVRSWQFCLGQCGAVGECSSPSVQTSSVQFMRYLTLSGLLVTLFIIIIINILTAIGLAPGGSSPVHIYREHYIEYTNNAQNT